MARFITLVDGRAVAMPILRRPLPVFSLIFRLVFEWKKEKESTCRPPALPA